MAEEKGNKVSKEFIEDSYKLICEIHNKIIEQSGGENGVRDAGGLYNSIHKIFQY